MAWRYDKKEPRAPPFACLRAVRATHPMAPRLIIPRSAPPFQERMREWRTTQMPGVGLAMRETIVSRVAFSECSTRWRRSSKLGFVVCVWRGEGGGLMVVCMCVRCV